ncbi:peptide-methionine (R)-S-oxide reductase MsrB [Candidatus Nomurabacteria bacterium]|nr:peptide-methionine (R)-S-oxide reductase MsrB [Candidatus Nomurabacteria bacterium]
MIDFIRGIFIAIAAFFGFGGGVMEVPAEVPVVATQEQIGDRELGVEVEVGGGAGEVESAMSEAEPATSPAPDATIKTDNQNEMTNIKTQSVDNQTPNIKTMMVAGGCFWCVESDLEKVHGVTSVVSGYAGGSTENPTYSNYGSGGHREVVQVTYDANQVSFEDILIVTMKTTDPTDDDGTFADRGDKYSSAFYYENDEQKAIIDNLIQDVNENGPYDKPLAIDVEPEPKFWPAEDYHQDYYKGTLSQLKYKYYRNASGRDKFIEKYWGVNDHSPVLSWRTKATSSNKNYMWNDYKKPSEDSLENQLDELTFKVTQNEGTEKAGSSPLDKNYEPGIYVDVLSGEPLYSSKDKFDSGTGWPSFVRPITPTAVTEHVDKKLFSTRTEIRSAIADNHLGHVFNDGPKDSTGLRYCMNGVALRFVPKDQMEAEGYEDFLPYI